MRPVTSFGIHFCLRKSTTSTTHSSLMVAITTNGKRKKVSLEHKVLIANWLPKEEKLKGPDIETKNLNSYINEVRAKLYEAKRQLILDSQEITPDSIWNKFQGKEEDGYTLTTIIKYHNDSMKDLLAWGTAKNYYTTEKYVKEFLKTTMQIEDIYISKLNYKFLMDFDMFLRNHVPGENQKPCTNNTVMKHIERLRKIVTMAVKNDWLKQDPFIKFQSKFIKKERGFLSEEELKVIELKPIFNESLNTVRDLFVFSCYTGLAFSDAYNLTKENLIKGIDGEMWITTTRQKTDVKAQIPLLPKALSIIEKYRNHPKAISTGALLPIPTNQRFNAFLKEIANLCDISKNLTHHLARHTFATTVCLSNGVSMEATSGMLGHASMRTTQIYGKILPKRISSEMQLLKAKMLADNIDTKLKVVNE